jgi:transcriptional regulator with XRE-family HTH domain
LEELKRLREEKGWSQTRLAQESGVDRATINQVEGGRRSPTISTLELLATALGAEVADFFPKAQAPLPFDDARRRGAKEEAEYARSSTVPDRIGAAKTFEDNLRHFTEKWREEIKDPHKQGVYWCAGVQATAIGLTDLFGKLGFTEMIGRKIGEVGQQSPGGLIEEMKKGKSGRAISDPEFVAAMDLLKAFEDMHDASDQVLEADETVDWITIKEAEQRREAFSIIQGDLSA